MYRINRGYEDVEQWAHWLGIDFDTLPTALARCQHGKTQTQFCTSCEGGYVDDTHSFVEPRGAVADDRDGPIIGTFDDGMEAVYIPERYQDQVAAIEKCFRH